MCLRGVAALGLRDRCEKHREMDFAVRIVGIGEDIVAPDRRIQSRDRAWAPSATVVLSPRPLERRNDPTDRPTTAVCGIRSKS
jgi:hypothetical protein